MTSWPGDAGPFITMAMVITRDPETGVQNLGMYRMQVTGPRTTFMHWQRHKGGAAHYRRYRERGETRMPVVVALGADPATMYTPTAPLPPGIDEYLFSGFLRREPLAIASAVTTDLKVPAEAEIVLEGYVDATAPLELEGPFGDHTGYYNEQERFPVFTIERITSRRDPIYHSTYTGKPPDEPAVLALALNEVFVPLIVRQFPEIVDFYLPPEGCSYRIACVSMRKQYPGQARRVMFGIWSYLRQFLYTKFIIVTDSDVNVRDWKEVVWALTTRVDPRRDTLIAEGTPIDYLDFASPVAGLGSKMGIDATHKWPAETSRSWGRRIEMDAEVKRRVDALWKDPGL